MTWGPNQIDRACLAVPKIKFNECRLQSETTRRQYINNERNLGYKIVGKPKKIELYVSSLIPNRLYGNLMRLADSELVWFWQTLIGFLFWYSELASMESTSSSSKYE